MTRQHSPVNWDAAARRNQNGITDIQRFSRNDADCPRAPNGHFGGQEFEEIPDRLAAANDRVDARKLSELLRPDCSHRFTTEIPGYGHYGN